MADPSNSFDECLGACRASIDDKDEWGYCVTNLTKWRQTQSSKRTRFKRLNPMIFILVEHLVAYDAHNSYALTKGFGIRRSRITKSITNQKVIRRQFVCNKECHECGDKRQERQDVALPRDSTTRHHQPAVCCFNHSTIKQQHIQHQHHQPELCCFKYQPFNYWKPLSGRKCCTQAASTKENTTGTRLLQRSKETPKIDKQRLKIAALD